MRINFYPSLRFTLEHEGGYTDDPDDPGNWTGGKKGKGVLEGTNFGISAAAYPHLDIKALTQEDAARIYKVDYWNPVNGDALPAGVDLFTFDFGVNAGPFESTTCLQQLIGVSTDGVVGPITLKACKDFKGDLLLELATAHDQYYETLEGYDEYGDGWIRRVTEGLRAARDLKHGA